MGIELPGALTEPLAWIGMTWPEADEDKLFSAGQTWLSYGGTLRGQEQTANSTAQQVWTSNDGAAIDAFETWWAADAGPGPNLGKNAEAAELIGAGLIAMAAITLALKIAFIAQLIALAIEVAQAIATAFVTFGATTAEIPGFIALTRGLCRAALNKVISMVEREIAELFARAAKLLEKVGAKDLSKFADRTAGKLGKRAVFHDLLGQTDRVDVSSPLNGAHFYSGNDGAGKEMRSYAEKNTDGLTSVTLEQTPGGKYFDDMHLYKTESSPISHEQADRIWGRLSERYGRGAEGGVTSWVHDPRDTSIYNTKELPALIKNPSVTSIRQVDPVTGGVTYPKP